ncbi:MAG: DUF1073 domain-containing protein [Blastopirellula sp.]|nr:MAG: DUF1073 domain-containing protein [Blastopirellula sp.]
MDKQFIANATTRYMNTMFGGYFGNASPKHNHWYDFGYPVDITFSQYYTMYRRNGIARAGIQRPVQKTWRDHPVMRTAGENSDKETLAEKAVREAFDRVRFWEKLKDLDEKSRVHNYAGLIIRVADDKDLKEPLEKVTSGLNGLIELIPVYSEQLIPLKFDDVQTSLTYGQPLSFTFTESAVGLNNGAGRNVEVHASRVHIWSEDSTIYGKPALEAGFNDLITIEKVMGAGGEGFWKEAKSAPILNIDKDASMEGLAKMLGTTVEGLPDKMDEVVGDWQQGFDQLLMVQGMDAKKLTMKLPQPEQFIAGPMQSFAASMPIPMKILLGSQTGERASTEDGKEWCETIQGRRTNFVLPNVMRIIQTLVDAGIMPDEDWTPDWSDLSEASGSEKTAKGKDMATINKEFLGTGEIVFTAAEIREEMGYKPLNEADRLTDDIDDEDKEAAEE